MKQPRLISAFCIAVALLLASGCAATATRESTGEYIDDSVITTRVKQAIFNDATLKSSEINVETFKGTVQLSGFVSSQENINKAVVIATGIKGVVSVKNDMRSK